MSTLFIILIVIYGLSILLLSVAYANKGFNVTLWAMIALLMPVVNTALILYLWRPATSLKEFIAELRERRNK